MLLKRPGQGRSRLDFLLHGTEHGLKGRRRGLRRQHIETLRQGHSGFDQGFELIGKHQQVVLRDASRPREGPPFDGEGGFFPEAGHKQILSAESPQRGALVHGLQLSLPDSTLAGFHAIDERRHAQVRLKEQAFFFGGQSSVDTLTTSSIVVSPCLILSNPLRRMVFKPSARACCLS